jgi:hypothetical protein
MEGRREENLLCWLTWVVQGWRIAMSKGPNRVGFLLFSPIIHLKAEHSQLPKRCDFNVLIARKMEKVQKPIITQIYLGLFNDVTFCGLIA